MLSKVLIVDSKAEEKEAFEQTLHEVVEAGGELIFTNKREDGLLIMKKEKPQLVFLDASFLGNEEEWVEKGVHVVVIQSRNDHNHKSEDVIFRPLKRHQILEKARSFLAHEPAPQVPPM